MSLSNSCDVREIDSVTMISLVLLESIKTSGKKACILGKILSIIGQGLKLALSVYYSDNYIIIL